MDTNLALLQQSRLFSGIDQDSLSKMLTCLAPRQITFRRGTFVFRAEDEIRWVYLILSGSMHIIDEDFWGNSSIIETLPTNALFGEAYVFSSRQCHLVSVAAAEDSVILELDPHKLFVACASGCACHQQLTRNALGIVSEKVVRLTEKLGHVMRRTLREKMLSYLTNCAQKANSPTFDIPYNRQQLADYLCVDRSALSHELSHLQKQGYLTYRKNHFTLTQKP